MELAGSDPLFCPFSDPVVAFFAHMGMNGPVAESFRFKRIVDQFFDGITDYTLHTHGESSYSTRIAKMSVMGLS